MKFEIGDKVRLNDYVQERIKVTTCPGGVSVFGGLINPNQYFDGFLKIKKSDDKRNTSNEIEYKLSNGHWYREGQLFKEEQGEQLKLFF